MLRSLMVKTTLAALTCVISFYAHAIEEAPKRFDVPAGEIVAALESLAKQADIELVYQAEQLKGIRTKGISGVYAPKEAVSLLIKGTQLVIRTDDATGVMLITPPSTPTLSSREKGEQEVSSSGNTVRPEREEERGMRVAQAEGQSPSSEEDKSPDKDPQEKLEEIVVTGTHIRGADPLSPLIRATRDDIIAQGYSRLDQFIEHLPQNYAGGGSSQRSNPTTTGGGGTGSYNYAFASGVNLRGLGANATLVLLNGQRLPQTAYGASVDISRIPLSALERVEILTDGASATYGADAVAGVANIITRTRFEGFETGMRIDAFAAGKDPNYGIYALAGSSWESGNVLLSYDYEKAYPLLARDRSFSAYLMHPTMLLPENETSSAYASVRQEIGPSLSVSADVLASRRTYLSTYDAFGLLGRNFGEGDQYTVNAQGTYSFGDNWAASLAGNFGQEKDQHDVVQGASRNAADIEYRNSSIDARVNGSMFELPAGSVRMAFGAEMRAESFRNVTPPRATNDRKRNVRSVYGEVLIPIVQAQAGVPWVRDLRINISGRHDRYDDFGSSTNPKFALQWAPVKDWVLSASYGTSFRAPVLSQLDPNAGQAGYVYDFPDPSSPGGVRRSLFLDNSANSDLKSESSRALNFNLAYQPLAVPGLSFEASYFDIEFSDRIIRLSDRGLLNVLIEADQYGRFLNLSPTLEEINRTLALPDLRIIDFNFPAGFTPDQIKAIAYLGYVNAATDHPRGVDFTPRYRWSTGVGELRLEGNASYFMSYDTRFTPSASPGKGVDKVGFPPRLRAKLEGGWNKAAWSGYARANYTKAYRNQVDTRCAGGCPISAYTTFDVGIAYSTLPGGTVGSGLLLALDVANVFDEAPPFVAVFDGHFDGANANPLGRAFALKVSRKW